MQKIMNFMLLSCKEATLLMEKNNVLPLSLGEKIRKKLHTSMCSACRSYERQSDIMNSVVSKWVSNSKHTDEKLPKDVKENIINQIKQNE